MTASFELANTNLPTPDESLVSIIPKFLYQGLSVTDMVALVGMFLLLIYNLDRRSVSYHRKIILWTV